MKLTEEYLERIYKYTNEATQAPWKYNNEYGYLAPTVAQRDIAMICNEISKGRDVEFIVNARTDIPLLLNEIERLRKENYSYEQIKMMREMLKVQGDSGNWNYDEYMFGMYNGMEYMLSIAENREPSYREKPSYWLKDAEVDVEEPISE